MSKPLVNGDGPHSKVLSHVTSYPVVHDSIEFYKSNPYGQQSIDVASNLYDRLARPFFPYLQTPYSYVKPYAEKADSLGDDGLTRIESSFPIVKEDTETVKKTAINYATFPIRVAGEGKDYVLNTFNDEYNKTSGDGVIRLAKATISTELKFTLDAYQIFYQYWTQSKEAAQSSRKDAEARLADGRKQVEAKFANGQKKAESKLADGQKKAEAKTNEVKEKASN